MIFETIIDVIFCQSDLLSQQVKRIPFRIVMFYTNHGYNRVTQLNGIGETILHFYFQFNLFLFPVLMRSL